MDNNDRKNELKLLNDKFEVFSALQDYTMVLMSKDIKDHSREIKSLRNGLIFVTAIVGTGIAYVNGVDKKVSRINDKIERLEEEIEELQAEIEAINEVKINE